MPLSTCVRTLCTTGPTCRSCSASARIVGLQVPAGERVRARPSSPRSPLDRLVLEAADHHVVQPGVHVRQQWRGEAPLRYVLGQLDGVQTQFQVGLGTVGERLPEEHAERPDVTGARPRAANEALGRHPLQRERLGRLQLVAPPRLVFAAQSKVTHLN